MNLLAKFANPQFLASLRHLLTAVATAAVVLGFISASDSEQIVSTLIAIGQAIGQIGGALAIIVPILMGAWSSRSASPTQQIASVQAMADDATSSKSDAAKTALVNATSSIANDPQGTKTVEAKAAILNAAASIPEVEKVVAPLIHQEVPSDKVVAQ